MPIDSKEWVENQLSALVLATRQSWAIRIPNSKSKSQSVNRVQYQYKFLSWEFSENGCSFDIHSRDPAPVFLAHPILKQFRIFSWTPINEKHPGEPPKKALELWLNDRIKNPKNPIEIEEINTDWELVKSQIDSYPPEKKNIHKEIGLVWPKLNGGGIPWEYDATHYVTGIKIVNKHLDTKAWFDDIRFHQYGCVKSQFTHAIDRHYENGVGGQRGSVEDFTNKIDELIETRGNNSKIQIFRSDHTLLLDAWTSSATFSQEWKKFTQWAVHQNSQPTIIVDGVMESRIQDYPPPEIRLNCYIYTPISDVNL